MHYWIQGVSSYGLPRKWCDKWFEDTFGWESSWYWSPGLPTCYEPPSAASASSLWCHLWWDLLGYWRWGLINIFDLTVELCKIFFLHGWILHPCWNSQLLLDVLKPTEELRSSFKFKFYLLVSKIYKVNFYWLVNNFSSLISIDLRSACEFLQILLHNIAAKAICSKG